MSFDLLGMLYKIYMFHLFIEKDFESKRGRKRKRKKGVKLYVWKMLTKDGIYCSYTKWICSSMGNYYKKSSKCLRNYKMR